MGVYKQIAYNSSRIDVCRNCGGIGTLHNETGYSVTCPVCDGKGRVRRTTEGVLTIENL